MESRIWIKKRKKYVKMMDIFIMIGIGMIFMAGVMVICAYSRSRSNGVIHVSPGIPSHMIRRTGRHRTLPREPELPRVLFPLPSLDCVV